MKSKTKQQILDLSSDLRRISWWACDRKAMRDALIERFLALVKKQKETLGRKNKKVDSIVSKELFDRWPEVKISNKDKLIWAEGILTASLRLKHLAEAPSP